MGPSGVRGASSTASYGQARGEPDRNLPKLPCNKPTLGVLPDKPKRKLHAARIGLHVRDLAE
jgi:hypothetical protein